MAWKFKKAIRDLVRLQIVVTIEDDSDPENVQERVFVWSYPAFDGQTAAQFLAMVRGEVIAHLRRLNAGAGEEDISDQFEGV